MTTGAFEREYVLSEMVRQLDDREGRPQRHHELYIVCEFFLKSVLFRFNRVLKWNLRPLIDDGRQFCTDTLQLLKAHAL